MNKRILIGLVGVLGLAGTSAYAADGSGGYVGASVGKSATEIRELSFDETDTAFKVFGGYSFNSYVGVELAYVDAGAPSISVASETLEIATSGLIGSFVVGIPLGDSFKVFGKIGLAFYDVEAEIAGQRFDDSENDVAYGIGLSYSITDKFSVRTEYETIDVEAGDFSMFTLGGAFHF
jgi:opacity protein-like surface antigen